MEEPVKTSTSSHLYRNMKQGEVVTEATDNNSSSSASLTELTNLPTMAQTLGLSAPREVFSTPSSIPSPSPFHDLVEPDQENMHIDLCLETNTFSQHITSFFTDFTTPEVPSIEEHLSGVHDHEVNDDPITTCTATNLLDSSTALVFPSTSYASLDVVLYPPRNTVSPALLDDDDISTLEAAASTTSRSPQSSTSSSDVLLFPSRRTSTEEVTEEDDQTLSALPPCKVCGHKASGLHYGVNTCEACKGFFRRSLVSKTRYACSGWSDCEISPFSRNCAYCRFQKCIKLGMSKDAIKIGRYSLRKKSENFKEIREERKVLPHSADEHLNTERVSRSITEASLNYDQFYQLKQEAKQINRKMHEFKECSRLSNEIFGRKDTLSDAEYQSFYAATGLDVDGRREVIRHYGQMIHQSLSDESEFVKSIPGFSQLPDPDQISLINASAFDFWLLCSYRCHDEQLRVGLFPSNLPYTLDSLNILLGYDFMTTAFSISTKLSQLGLKPEEESLLKAVCLTFVDRAELVDRHAVESLQWKLLRCLMHILRRNYRATYNRKLYRIWNCVIEMRNGMEIYTRVLNKLISEDWLELRELNLCFRTFPKIEKAATADLCDHYLEVLSSANVTTESSDISDASHATEYDSTR